LHSNFSSEPVYSDTVSESHDSAQDSTEVKAASIAFYGLPGARFCQILGQQPEQIKIVNAHDQLARTKKRISDDLAAEEVKAAALMEHSLDPEAENRMKLWIRDNGPIF
jgi:hypothetical protein